MQGQDATRVMYTVAMAAIGAAPIRYFTGSGWHNDRTCAAFLAYARFAERVAQQERERFERTGRAAPQFSVEAVSI